jgi:hypothetical protein
MDCEQIVPDGDSGKRSKRRSRKVRDRDDLGGMLLNMSKKVDARELFIIWIVFLFIHTEMFCEHILKRFSNTTNADNTMTMKGTFYASMIMLLTVLICSVVF